MISVGSGSTNSTGSVELVELVELTIIELSIVTGSGCTSDGCSGTANSFAFKVFLLSSFAFFSASIAFLKLFGMPSCNRGSSCIIVITMGYCILNTTHLKT